MKAGPPAGVSRRITNPSPLRYKTNGCTVTFTFQLISRICHYESPRKQNRVGIEWENQPLAYVHDVNMLGENLQTVRENTETFIKARRTSV